jgi:hypothetical protein
MYKAMHILKMRIKIKNTQWDPASGGITAAPNVFCNIYYCANRSRQSTCLCLITPEKAGGSHFPKKSKLVAFWERTDYR